MKRYYLVTFSWIVGELCKTEEYKVFTNVKEPLREVASIKFIQNIGAQNIDAQNIDAWMAEQMADICINECSTTFKCEDGLFRIVATSDFPEKSKFWKHDSHNLIELVCDVITEAERDIKIDNILNSRS